MAVTEVRVKVFGSSDQPIEGARLSAVLSGVDIDPADHRFMTSTVEQADTDATGECSLVLWTNTEGEAGTTYLFTVKTPAGITYTVPGVVPAAGPVWLDQIIDGPVPATLDAALVAQRAAQAAALRAEAAAGAMCPMPGGLALAMPHDADGNPLPETGTTAAGVTWTRSYTFEAGRIAPLTTTVTNGSQTWVRTFTYTGPDLTAVSEWVLQ